MENVTNLKSPAKRKQPQRDSQTQPKSPGKEKVPCRGCDKKFELLLSHLERTESCQNLYDMSAMREEAKKLTKERKAQRSRDRYRIDSPQKRAAAAEYYKDHTPEKRATMEKYNREHKAEISEAMKKNYHEDQEKKKKAMKNYYTLKRSYTTPLHEGDIECPICEKHFFTQKDMKRHIDHIHSDEEKSFTCQVCDKQLHYKEDLDRHMREVHGGEKHKCAKCPASFVRNSELQKHIEKNCHYLSFYCDQCKKNIVFKHFGGLINHVIVKQSESKRHFPAGSKFEGQTYTVKKTGIVVTCKSCPGSTELEEGRENWRKQEKIEADEKRIRKKEDLINTGLKSAHGSYEKPNVRLSFDTTHKEDEEKGLCKYCQKKSPFEHDDCRGRAIWELHYEDSRQFE